MALSRDPRYRGGACSLRIGLIVPVGVRLADCMIKLVFVIELNPTLTAVPFCTKSPAAMACPFRYCATIVYPTNTAAVFARAYGAA